MEIFRAKPLRRRAELFGATAECAILPVAILKSPGRTAVYVDKILKGTMRANLQQQSGIGVDGVVGPKTWPIIDLGRV
jgi:hypothetical protein